MPPMVSRQRASAKRLTGGSTLLLLLLLSCPTQYMHHRWQLPQGIRLESEAHAGASAMSPSALRPAVAGVPSFAVFSLSIVARSALAGPSAAELPRSHTARVKHDGITHLIIECVSRHPPAHFFNGCFSDANKTHGLVRPPQHLNALLHRGPLVEWANCARASLFQRNLRGFMDFGGNGIARRTSERASVGESNLKDAMDRPRSDSLECPKGPIIFV